jgi:hypothetical protein
MTKPSMYVLPSFLSNSQRDITAKFGTQPYMISSAFPPPWYRSDDRHSDMVSRAKKILSVGTANVQAEVIYVPAIYQGEVWASVLAPSAVDMIKRRLPFDRIRHPAERVFLDKDLEAEFAKMEGRNPRTEGQLTPPAQPLTVVDLKALGATLRGPEGNPSASSLKDLMLPDDILSATQVHTY